MQFNNRTEAGRWLAPKLNKFAARPDVVVLALQGGGVPIANEVSRSLQAPADILVVRKLRVPGEDEVVFGAITSGGMRVLNHRAIEEYKLTPAQVEDVIAAENEQLALKEKKFRGDRPFPHLEGRTVIVVDDGLGTGSSLRVALQAIRQQKPRHIVIALPVAPPTVFYDFKELADEIICLMTPKDFSTVHDYYLEYHAVTDDEIQKLLEWVAGRMAAV